MTYFLNQTQFGLPIPNVEYKINNPDNEGIGEIIVKGPNVMIGYFNNPEDTDKVFKKGWYYTGDLGYIDHDGFLYITGRCKNVIVTQNGKNIFPEEIEYYLNESPLVKECIIVGTSYDNTTEVSVNAKIFPDIDSFKELLGKENISNEDINSEIKALIASVNKRLPNYKHIKNFKIVSEEFEKTTTQKIKRFGNNLSM